MQLSGQRLACVNPQVQSLHPSKILFSKIKAFKSIGTFQANARIYFCSELSLVMKAVYGLHLDSGALSLHGQVVNSSQTIPIHRTHFDRFSVRAQLTIVLFCQMNQTLKRWALFLFSFKICYISGVFRPTTRC